MAVFSLLMIAICGRLNHRMRRLFKVSCCRFDGHQV
jgi:hypothetical protein